MEDYPYVDFEGIRESAYGMTIPSQAEGSINRLIKKSGERLAARVQRIPERVASGQISRDLVAGVVEDMVIRVIRNPYGFASEQAGEFMYRIDAAASSGRIQVTDEEVALLTDSGSPAFAKINQSLPAYRAP